MKIGIDAHSLEGIRTGARGRYLLNLLREWADMETGDAEFILYFQKSIPPEAFLNRPKFIKKVLCVPFGMQSFTIYYNFLLPFAATLDKVDICLFPFYMLPYTYRPKNAAVVLHDVAFEVHPEWFSPRHRLPLHLLAKNAAKNARYILTISQFSKREIMRAYGVNPEKIHVIYLAPDRTFEEQKNEDGVRQVRVKYNLTQHYFFFVGSIFGRRHIPECIEAFSRIARDFPDWQFFICGRNLTRPRIEIDERISKVNMDLGRDAILHVNWVDDADLTSLYHGSDAVVYLSDYEGFGLPVLEGMSVGKPVLTSRADAIEEVVGADWPAMVPLPVASDAIFSYFERIASNAAFRNDLIQRGSEVITRYSWRKTAKETLDVFLSR